MNGYSGCYCGNCSESANSCNVTTGGVSLYKISLCSHHHYHRGKLTALSSCCKNLKVHVLAISLYHKAWVVLQGVYTFKGMLTVATVIYSEQENEDKVLPGLRCFDGCQQTEKKKLCFVGLIVINQMKEFQTKVLITADP